MFLLSNLLSDYRDLTSSLFSHLLCPSCSPELESRIDALSSLNATLKTQAKDLEQQVTDLKRATAKKNLDIESLQAQLKKSAALVAELTTANKTLKQANTDAAAANAREKAATKAANVSQLTALENTHKQAMKKQVSDHDAKIATLNNEGAKKEAVANKLQAEVNALMKTVAEMTLLKEAAEATRKSDAEKVVALERELQQFNGVNDAVTLRVSDLETQLDSAKKVLDAADAKLILSMSGAVAAKGRCYPFRTILSDRPYQSIPMNTNTLYQYTSH